MNRFGATTSITSAPSILGSMLAFSMTSLGAPQFAVPPCSITSDQQPCLWAPDGRGALEGVPRDFAMASRDIYGRQFDEDIQKNSHNTCPECDGRVSTNTHETLCDDCGLVLSDQAVDHGPEWRNFEDSHGDARRAGAPNTVARHDRGIGSEIGWGSDANGGTIGGRKRRRLGRLRQRHSRAKVGSKADRNQIRGFTEIRRMIGALGLAESVRDQACQLFKTAQDEGMLCGRSVEMIASACIYAVCRLNEHPRTFTEVGVVSKVSEDKIRHGYSVLNRELGLPVPPAAPRRYLPQIASDVGVRRETERRAREYLDEQESVIPDGANPLGVAAGAIYLAAQETGEFVTQGRVAEVADVSEVTVRKRYRDLGERVL